MSSEKKKIRAAFRAAVMKRDQNRCRKCGWNKYVDLLDAHHITDRNQMAHGGYVKENGISLCPECHIKAETFHEKGMATPGYSPSELYELIGSSFEEACKASEKLV